MSTMPTSSTAPGDERSPWQRWKDFWFQAADPTTLGFIRICTGLLVLYIHLAYSLDLQAFFGEHGWYAKRFIDRERHEIPAYAAPFWGGYEDRPRVAQLSEFPHRRRALMTFLRGLPADKTQRTAAMAYLDRLNTFPLPDAFAAIIYVQRLGTRPEELNNSLTVLTGGELATPEVTARYRGVIPPFFRDMPLEERQKLAGEIRAFWTALSKIKWIDPDRDRNYVFNHFAEVAPDSRQTLVNYIETLPEDQTERDKLLDYLEYWNSDPRQAMRLGSGIFSIWFHVTDPTQMALIHAGVLVIIVLFTLGVFTRVTSVLTWLACISYIHRTQQVLFGMDTMMNILLFYLMLGNCGAALSVDRLIARYRAARASLRRFGMIDANTRAFLACPPPSVASGFTQRLIQVHFCFIYAAAGLSKLKGGAWWNGSAFWYVVVNPEFTPLQYHWYESMLRGLASIKPLYYFVTITGVWFTLFVEIGVPFLIWTRLRWLMILLATAMHALIAVLMGLNLFELLMIVMLLAFLPDRVIRDRFRAHPGLPRLRFTFNPQNAAQGRAAALALALDADNQIALQPDPSATTTTLSEADGKPVTGQEGVGVLWKDVRLLGILRFVLWIPGMRGLSGQAIIPHQHTARRRCRRGRWLRRRPAEQRTSLEGRGQKTKTQETSLEEREQSGFCLQPRSGDRW